MPAGAALAAGGGGAQTDGDGFSPCDLLSGADVANGLPWVEGDEMVSVRQLARYQDGIDACRIGPEEWVDCGGCDFAVVEVGVQAGSSQQSLDDVLAGLPDTPSEGILAAEDVDGVGDRAIVASDGPGAYQLWAEVGDSLFYLGATGDQGHDHVDEIIELAGIAADNVPDDRDPSEEDTEVLPEDCDTLDRAVIEEVLGGPVVLARGTASDAGIYCSYQADTDRTAEGEGLFQAGLDVSVKQADDDVSRSLDDLAAGTYGDAEELPGLGQRAVLRTEEAEINGLVDQATQFKVEGFLAYRDGDPPPDALVQLAESALAMASS